MIIKGDKTLVKNLIKSSKQMLIPYKIFFELTYNCNLKCKHCIVYKDKDRQELTYDQIIGIIDQVAEFGCIYINFTGGEPLSRKEFFEIAGYTKRKGLAFTIQTNGTLITPEIADKIAVLSPLQVSVTLLGANQNTHDGITGIPDSYKRTTEAVKLLRKRNIHVCISTIAMKYNAAELSRIEHFAQEVNSSWVSSSQIINKFNGSEEPTFCRVFNWQLKDGLKKHYHEYIDKNKRGDILNEPFCNVAGGSSTAITAYGDLNPCPAWMRNKNRSLINGRKIFQIWQEDSDFKRIRTLRKKDLPVCRDCDLLLYCSLCPVLNFFENGDILKPAKESCRKAKAKKEALKEREEGKNNGGKIK